MNPFERAFRERYHSPLDLSESRTYAMQKEAGLDHPSYVDLELGEAISGEAAVLFLDIRGYTRLAMAFADEPETTAKIIDAVVGGSVEALPEYDAHINDFTGDGVMAIFGGDPGSLDAAHNDAVWAVVDLMTAMSALLRQELLDVAIDDPVQVAMGLVSGPVLWKRVGTERTSRVMALGEVAPLAAKYVSGGETKAWETMIGGEVIDAVPLDFRTKVDDYVHEYKGEQMSRERWLLETSRLWNAVRSSDDVARIRGAAAASAAPSLAPSAPRERRGDASRRERTIG